MDSSNYKFQILEIQDVIPKDGLRRIVTVIAEIIKTGETTVVPLSYTAYGDEHYPASTLDYLNKLDGRLNHVLARDISEEVKRFWGYWPKRG